MARTIPTTLDTASPALSQLSADERAALRELTVTRLYDAGEMIFHEGDPGAALWFVEKGRVRLFKTAPDGRELTVCIARTSDRFCLGTCPLFDGDVNPVSAQALEAVTLRLINKREVLTRLSDSAQAGLVIGKMMADRYRHFAHLAGALALHCVRVRVADALVETAQARGTSTARGIELELDLTQEMLASCLGTDRAVIARTLLAFEREGLLDARGRHVTLLNLPALQRVANHVATQN